MKDKRRNSEKRKEKSRDAARCRRSKESEVFYDLANSLPLPQSVTSQLDKASVMRLAISFLKICNVLDQQEWTQFEKKKVKGEVNVDHLFPKALDGFVFILSHEGDIIYVNESVVKYLGIQQIELIGQSIFEFSHPRDEDEIREALSVRSQRQKAPVTEERVFFFRMKCTLTSKGRNVNLKSASYKVIKCTGRLVTQETKGDEACAFSPYLLSIGEPIPHPANIEIPMDKSTFLSKHDMNMHFTYCDERVKDLVNYSSEELVGKSLFDYHHALDGKVIEKAYKDLLSKGKGQTMTGPYRFLARGGGMAWVITQSTVIYNNRNQKAQWVVCVHYVLSQVEQKDLILSEVQLPSTCSLPKGMQLSTKSTFSRKTDDMEKGYYIPPEIQDTVNMINNEPDDLSYLAPTAGDECVPLNFPFSQGPLVKVDDSDSGTPDLLMMKLKKEPGMLSAVCNPREPNPFSSPSPSSNNSTCPSSRMSSPRDYVNIASPELVTSMEQFFQNMDTKADEGKDDMETIDFNTRAPYIPMNGDEDLSLLPPSTDSLLTLQNDVDPGLFGKTENVFIPKAESLFSEPPQPPKPSLRDMLCGSTAVASIEQPPDNMFQQIKRPLDMNSLEKGPPAHKIQCLGHPQIHGVPPMRKNNDSVLLNLLLTGEDPNGYKVMGPNVVSIAVKRGFPKERISKLQHLTQRDFEVNAPTQCGGLLQGADLLQALEIDIPQTPH